MQKPTMCGGDRLVFGHLGHAVQGRAVLSLVPSTWLSWDSSALTLCSGLLAGAVVGTSGC